MKRLIVLIALATLLASLSGCGILSKKRGQSCDTTSPAPSRLPTVSLPWQRGTAGGDCTTCNQGFVDSGFTDTGYVDGGLVSSAPASSLYSPDVVYEGPVVQSTPATSYGIVPTTPSLGGFSQ